MHIKSYFWEIKGSSRAFGIRLQNNLYTKKGVRRPLTKWSLCAIKILCTPNFLIYNCQTLPLMIYKIIINISERFI